MNNERTILQSYKEVACAIVEKHMAVLSSQTSREKNTERPYKDINTAVKLINRELEAGAEKMLQDVKPDKNIDCRRLKELLFLIRRDFFNDFLRKNEPVVAHRIPIAY